MTLNSDKQPPFKPRFRQPTSDKPSPGVKFGRDSRIKGSETQSTPSKEVEEFHYQDDLDFGPRAHHHTLGTGPNQAASGAHQHPDIFRTIYSFGARGKNVEQDSVAIRRALNWWKGASYRHLHFGAGLWLYDHQRIQVDMGTNKYNRISMDGAVKAIDPGAVTGNPVAWEIFNGIKLDLQINIDGGGKLGNFTTRLPGDGGTTFLKIHAVRGCDIEIRSEDYAGRILHCTAEDTIGTARARNLNVWMKYGPRQGGTRTGQPLYIDTNNNDQTGAIGKFNLRGEGQMYGPVWERLNDVYIEWMELGMFINTGVEFRGVQVMRVDFLYVGETDAGSTTEDLVTFTTHAATGRQCGDIAISHFRGLRGRRGMYINSLVAGMPFIIESFRATKCELAGVEVNNSHNVHINGMSGKELQNLLTLTGTCTDGKFDVSDIGTITGTPITVSLNTTDCIFTGSMKGGAAGFSLIRFDGTGHNAIDMVLDSDVVAQKISVPAGNSLYWNGGRTSGSSPSYNNRPKYIAPSIKGLRSMTQGTAVILNGTNTITVNHGLSGITPAHVSVTGLHAETSDAIVPSRTSTQITITVPANVTADRTVMWRADGTYQVNDLGA